MMTAPGTQELSVTVPEIGDDSGAESALMKDAVTLRGSEYERIVTGAETIDAAGSKALGRAMW
ncbi:MAG: hypothetical protein LBV00_02610 [Propionibacteriaceae bacterium]|jgi:hypothetical protein|nr:hypothetical protein [Propionibacteriaceae bacterium]